MQGIVNFWKAVYNKLSNNTAIDTVNGLFKIVRVGLNVNMKMTSVEYMCYDYINKKVLYEK